MHNILVRVGEVHLTPTLLVKMSPKNWYQDDEHSAVCRKIIERTASDMDLRLSSLCLLYSNTYNN